MGKKMVIKKQPVESSDIGKKIRKELQRRLGISGKSARRLMKKRRREIREERAAKEA